MTSALADSKQKLAENSEALDRIDNKATGLAAAAANYRQLTKQIKDDAVAR